MTEQLTLGDIHKDRPRTTTAAVQLRPYQEESLVGNDEHQGIIEALAEHGSTLLVLPTGTGKTVVFAEAIQRLSNKRALVIAHRDELIRQAANRIRLATGIKPEIEKADERAIASARYGSPIIVSSVQTQATGRCERFDPNDFDLVIIDEAHHATAPSYRRVIEHYQQYGGVRVLGVTATPDRADEAALGQVFKSVAYTYDLPEAIRDGWLVPVVQQSVFVEDLDLSSVRARAGDLSESDLAKIMEEEQIVQEMIVPTVELAAGRKTLIFCSSVHHAELARDLCNRIEPDSAELVTGKTPLQERQDIFAAYARGDIRYLCNVGVATEGFDDPGVEVVVIGRPTKSRPLFAQMVGRGTRVLPGLIDGIDTAEERRKAIANSPKPTVTVLDFVGATGKHKLVSTADILGGNYDDEAIALARRKVEERSKEGKPADVAELLEEAKEELRRWHLEERRRRERVVAKAKYSVKTVDPFDIFDIEPKRTRGWDNVKRASNKQIEVLKRHGWEPPEGERLSAARASQLIGEICRRGAEGMATFKQVKLLKRHGVLNAAEFDRQTATRYIDAIAGNGWRGLPHDFIDERVSDDG